LTPESITRFPQEASPYGPTALKLIPSFKHPENPTRFSWHEDRRVDDYYLSFDANDVADAGTEGLSGISMVRPRMGPDSDLDLLIIMPDGIHRRQTAQTIYSSLKGLGLAKDIVVATEGDVHNYGDNPSLVLCPALREGRELYRAPG
jgi:uncharacterized protein